MPKDYFDKAVDPAQYDKEEVQWVEYGQKDDPVRVFYKDVLRSEIKSLENKKVLDVGSGSGAFFEFYQELGASEVKGIEPSKANFQISRKLFPDIEVINEGLMEAKLEGEFDTAFAIMVFEHLSDILNAYTKVRSLLKDGGLFYVIFQDLDYLRDPRHSNPVDFEEGEDGTIAVRVQSQRFGTVYDLLRTPDYHIKVAQQAGFSIEKHIPLFPSEQLCQKVPKYSNLKDRAFRQLLILKK